MLCNRQLIPDHPSHTPLHFPNLSPPSPPAAPPGPVGARGSRPPRRCSHTRPGCTRGTTRPCSCVWGCVYVYVCELTRIHAVNNHPPSDPLLQLTTHTCWGRPQGCTSHPPASSTQNRARGSGPGVVGPVMYVCERVSHVCNRRLADHLTRPRSTIHQASHTKHTCSKRCCRRRSNVRSIPECGTR